MTFTNQMSFSEIPVYFRQIEQCQMKQMSTSARVLTKNEIRPTHLVKLYSKYLWLFMTFGENPVYLH